MTICLVCSSGGHFYELYRLHEAWKTQPRFWVTFKSQDTQVVLKRERVYSAYAPTNRSLRNFCRNFYLAWKVLAREKPQILVSTGAGVCVPFFIIAKLRGIKTFYIESLARVRQLSLTGRMIYLLADEFLVQWPELAEKYRRAQYRGQLL